MSSQGQAQILVVDDEAHNVKLLEALLHAEGYATHSAFSGKEALRMAQSIVPDLVLLDIMMPEMDGFETVTRLKSDPRTQPIPVIMVTALEDRDSKLRALQAGAEEFLTKPVDRADLVVRVRNLLRLKEYSDFLADHNRLLEEQVTRRTEQLVEAYRDTVYTLTCAAENKDEETGHHVRRISFYCRELAETLELPLDFCEAIFYASPMHDVGKIAIADRILLKPGAFTAEEWEVMRSHSAIGARILAKGSSPYMRMGAEIALSHHERWDGSGYPNGLKGEEIPLSARIMQICDVYDALRSKRPYKQAFDHDYAVKAITQGDGRTLPEHFDPAVLAAFIAVQKNFSSIYETHRDD